MKNAVILSIMLFLPTLIFSSPNSEGVLFMPPANDNCDDAILITGNSVTSGSNIGATAESPTVGCSGAGATNSVWYRFVGTGNSFYVSTCNDATKFDTQVSVIKGFDGFPICSFYQCVIGNDNGPGFPNIECLLMGQNLKSMTESFPTEVGKEYYIRVATGSLTGPGNFDLELVELIPAPITLTDFWGEAWEKGNTVVWETSSEQDVLWHILEKSSNGLDNWTEVGRLVSETTASQGAIYELIDDDPFRLTYYRLRTVGYDGKDDISSTISVQREKDDFSIGKIYPNPIMEGEITFQVNSDRKENIEIRVLDLSGKEITNFHRDLWAGMNEVQMDVTGWRSGVYFVQFISRQAHYTRKIFKQE